MGTPRKEDRSTVKTKHIMIRVSEPELKALKEIAGKEGVSAYLLRRAFEKKEEDK